MAEYTDREELRAAMQHIYNDPTCPMHISAEIEQIIDCAPAADVASVVHGRWILERTPDGKPYCFHCSACDSDYHHIGITVATDYCPNCGAKMDGVA